MRDIGRYHVQEGRRLTFKWRCSLSAMWRSPRRFCRHDVLIRFSAQQSFLSGLASSAQDSRILWVMTAHRPFGGRDQATPTGSRSGAPDNSQILRPVIFKMTATRRGDFPPMCDNAAPTRPSPSVG